MKPIDNKEQMKRKVKQVSEMLAAADPQDAALIIDIIACTCEVLRSESGAMVVIWDMEGDGTADMLALGNRFLIGPLLNSAPLVGKKVYAQPAEVLQ